MKRVKKQSKPDLKSCRTIFVMVVILSSFIQVGQAQHLVGAYTTSAPEATLFFLNPGYLNPALGSDALGLHSNPAGLHSIKGSRLSMAFSTAHSATGQFSFQAVDESEVFSAITLDSQLKIKETGGLGAVGFAHQTGNWVWGIALLQARKGGLALEAQGSVDLTTKFALDVPITKELFESLPVDEIPITWDVNTRGTIRFWSTPAELFLSIQPIVGGFSYQKGHLALGAGLTYYRLTSSHQVGEIHSQIEGGATVVGTPSGIDPLTNEPWAGSISADLDISDKPLVAQYSFDISGNRFAVTVGGMLNFKLLSLGATYSQGFRGTINGSYNITMIKTSDLPEKDILSDIDLDLTWQPHIEGHANLKLSDFKKDTLINRDRGTFHLGGYHAVSAGLHFLIFGAFVDAEIPKYYPDLYSASFGIYTDFPIPKLPLRFNAGFISQTDGIMGEAHFSVPFRVVSHVGAGLAFKLPTHQWFHFGQEPSWLRLGVRSSLTSYAMNIFESELSETEKSDLPSAFENVGWSFGLAVPF